jgi:hypothetical protein
MFLRVVRQNIAKLIYIVHENNSISKIYADLIGFLYLNSLV